MKTNYSIYANSNNTLHSKHASSTIPRLKRSLPPSPLPPQTTSVHHLVVSPCCTDQATAFLVSGGYTSHPGHFLRQQRSGDCCPTVSFSLFFLIKRNTLLPKLTCAEPGTSIHCEAVRKGWSIANLFSYNVCIKVFSNCNAVAMSSNCKIVGKELLLGFFARVLGAF